jgi:putative SOS response-associated peptidase YedK
MEPDSGTTNIRNTNSAHWKRWLGSDNRCLVPLTSFSEFDTIDGKKVSGVVRRRRVTPIVAFASIWTNWANVRKAKEGEVTTDIFGFLTCGPNAEVKRIHPKAMRAILTTAEEHEIWIRAPSAEAETLQRPLPDGTQKIVATGEKEDKGDGAQAAGDSRELLFKGVGAAPRHLADRSPRMDQKQDCRLR